MCKLNCVPPTLARSTRWLLFAGLVAFAVFGMTRLEVDPTNRAMKDPTSAAARNLQALGSILPDVPTLLLGFVTRGGEELGSDDREVLTQLVTELGHHAAVGSARLLPEPNPSIVLGSLQLAEHCTAEQLQDLLHRADTGAPPTTTVHATGVPLLEQAIAQHVTRDRAVLVPIIIATLALATLLIYRSLALMFATLLSPLLAIILVDGWLGWQGCRIDPVAALLEPILLTIGVAGSVHVVQAYLAAIASTGQRQPAARIAAATMLRPGLLATTTTLIGLWSLLASSIPAVRDLGLRAACGVALTHCFLFWLLPKWLAARGPLTPLPGSSASSLLAPLRALRRFRVPTLAAAAAVTALAVAGLARLSADNDVLQLLPRRERVRADHQQLAARLGGAELVHLLAPADSRASEPSRLVPFVASMQVRGDIAGLGGNAVASPAGDVVVPLLLRPAGSRARSALFDDMERTARVLGLDGLVPAGQTAQIARDSQQLLTGLVRSMGLAGLALAVTMMLGLRSVRLGLLALLPNVLPATWLFGLLGWIGHPLSVGSAMIASTMLGLIVDNTLHLLHVYGDCRKQQPPALAIAAALVQRGAAARTSTIVLLLGFLTTALSDLQPTVEFAWLAAATIAMAWVSTSVLLPLLLGAPDPQPFASESVS